jgi:hypothetical protein
VKKRTRFSVAALLVIVVGCAAPKQDSAQPEVVAPTSLSSAEDLLAAEGRPRLVARGKTGRFPWTLRGAHCHHGLCLELDVPTPNGRLGSGTCGLVVRGYTIPTDKRIEMVVDVLPEIGRTFVYGPVSRDVTRVQLTTDEAGTVVLKPRAGRSEFGVHFFAAALVGETGVKRAEVST